MDIVTFTISLPAAAQMREYVDALRAARNNQATLGNIGAAQALSCVTALAERGLLEFESSSGIVR